MKEDEYSNYEHFKALVEEVAEEAIAKDQPDWADHLFTLLIIIEADLEESFTKLCKRLLDKKLNLDTTEDLKEASDFSFFCSQVGHC